MVVHFGTPHPSHTNGPFVMSASGADTTDKNGSPLVLLLQDCATNELPRGMSSEHHLHQHASNCLLGASIVPRVRLVQSSIMEVEAGKQGSGGSNLKTATTERNAQSAIGMESFPAGKFCKCPQRRGASSLLQRMRPEAQPCSSHLHSPPGFLQAHSAIQGRTLTLKGGLVNGNEVMLNGFPQEPSTGGDGGGAGGRGGGVGGIGG